MGDGPQRDPDALLRLAEREHNGKGKLKIFFGMAAGVGKTYAMLQEGRQKLQEGLDVVVGYLESHQRREIEELASGFEVVPRRKLEHRGMALGEMDLDAVIARRPSLALVDELAHTNAPGSRNRKRYQDVRELILKGIDVSTTVNVQHLEGFADTVESVAGITVSERIPDSVFDAADQVVLIDLSPEELLKRFSGGKVYTPDMAQVAMASFFRKSTLTVLREMALRHTALLVNHELAGFAQDGASEGPPRTVDRLLVAISASPNSAHLIRWTRQRAFSLKAEWTALHVETGHHLPESAQETLKKNMNLARQLGAAVVTIPSDDVSEAVIGFARSNGISQIVVGKSAAVSKVRLLRGFTVTSRILEKSGEIDVAVVQEKGIALVPTRRARVTAFVRSEKTSLLTALVAIAAATGLTLVALPLIGYRSAGILYLLVDIALALLVSRPAVILSAILSAALWDYLFIPPRFTLTIGKPEDVLMFILYFVTTAALAFLTSRLRVNQRMLSVRERRLSLLYSLSQALSIKQNLHDIIHTSLEYATKYFDAHVMIFLRNGPESIEPEPRSLHEVAVDEKERGVAQWCFVNRTPCGKYTDVLHMARFHYIPLLAPDSAAGVLGVCLEEGRTWMPDQEDSLQMLGRTLALSLEREWLAEENRRNLTARESERLSRILLNTVSHELRTPLTAIKGSVTALMDASAGADPETRDILLSETLTATDRLNGIVENLLAMSRLESGVLRLKRSDVDVVDMTSVVADAFRRHGQDHPLTVRVEEELPPISVDLVLMVQVLANLVGNAVNHTPPGTPIELAAAQSEREIHLTVADSGPGVSSEELPRLFDPFFRGKRALGGGVGLGLSICRGIVEAHGGKISASINERGGITVLVALPEVAP